METKRLKERKMNRNGREYDRFFKHLLLDMIILMFISILPSFFGSRDFNFWIFLSLGMAYIVISHGLLFKLLAFLSTRKHSKLTPVQAPSYGIKYQPTCIYCGSHFSSVSHRIIDDYCSRGPICDSCIEKARKVITYSTFYQGRIPIDTNYAIHDIESVWFRDKKNALDELKLRAVNEGCNGVYDVNYSQDHATEGNYVFSIWRASGKAFIKKET